jgi:hypothetical protein
MTKFFFLSLFSSFIFISAFNPQTGLNYRPLRSVFPKWDSCADDGSFYMGADQMCQALCYFALMYHRYWYLAFGFIALCAMLYKTHRHTRTMRLKTAVLEAFKSVEVHEGIYFSY